MEQDQEAHRKARSLAITEAVLSAFGPQHAKTSPESSATPSKDESPSMANESPTISSSFEMGKPFTDQDIHRIEELLGRKLPDDYCKFVKEYGGARVHGIVDGSEDFPIDSFNEADQFNISAPTLPEWEEYREIGALPFASCLLGNIWVLTIKNEVFYIDYYKGETEIHKVADSFGDFVSRISLRKYDDQIGIGVTPRPSE